MKLRDNENIAVLGIFLGVIGLLSALVLALISHVTADPIAKAKAAQQAKAISQVLPEFDNKPAELVYETKTASKWSVKFMGAKKEGKLVGVAALCTSSKGYGGNIEMLMGIGVDGKIKAVLITANNETPGLGANICTRAFKKTIFNITKPAPAGLAPNEYLDQFNGRRAGEKTWHVKKNGGEFLYRTGATITSEAVTVLAYEINRAFETNKKEILSKFGGAK